MEFETGRPMQDGIKEHDRDIRLARTQSSAVSDYANNTGDNQLWNEVKVGTTWMKKMTAKGCHLVIECSCSCFTINRALKVVSVLLCGPIFHLADEMF